MDFQGRESRRIGSENFVSYRLFDADDRVFDAGMALTLDISRTGIGIRSDHDMETGLKIEVVVAVGDELVKTIGHIRNVKEMEGGHKHVGIEFDFLSDRELDKLAQVYPGITQ